MTPTLSAIHVFPIKSCAAWVRDEAEVEPRGLAGDRRWMVADANGKFLTARQHPRLTLVRAEVDGDALALGAPGMPVLRLAPPESAARIEATVWKSTVQAQVAEARADAWISAFLGLPARFVHMDADCVRAVDADYGRPGDEVSFADGYPLLLISQAALDALNAKLAQPVPMLRFRPSLVVTGTEPHAEDGWKRIRIGAVEFDVVKPCTRCVFTTVDYERGEFDPSGEPLRTLTTYRRTPKGVTFGQNLIPRGRGILRVGDTVEIFERSF
ncbi:MOSC domain-containing protein [Dokdonella sp.]|uniref:MOSC domain-containing protein n=1 Tax=Dokdonella sp. TaxID=2291710 RepID=UPI001B11048A|nr:MOSC domain-containing protein [Dokdonella sp.]MBO9664775.1 MOSC domain-containing protein [Dokdonella sp.]